MNSPYKPPGARVRDPRTNERGPTWKAITLGLATDVGGTMVFSTIASLVLSIAMAAQGLSEAQMVATFATAPYQVFGLFTGAAFTGLGGYVAARVANHLEYRHGLYLGLASLLLGEAIVQLSGADAEIWLRIASVILALPVAVIGAHLRVKQKRAEG